MYSLVRRFGCFAGGEWPFFCVFRRFLGFFVVFECGCVVVKNAECGSFIGVGAVLRFLIIITNLIVTNFKRK